MKSKNTSLMQNGFYKTLDLWSMYFRTEVQGLENIPDGPCLFVQNHNGGSSPGDYTVLPFLKKWLQEPVVVLAHDMVSQTPVLSTGALQMGIHRAHPKVADKHLQEGKKILVFPGGDIEAVRSYWKRNQIFWDGRKGFAKLAIKNNVPVVPVISHGSHLTFFSLSNGQSLAEKLPFLKKFRLNTFPVLLEAPWGLVVGPFAALPYLPFPAKIRFQIGKPIYPGKQSLSAFHQKVCKQAQHLLDGLSD